MRAGHPLAYSGDLDTAMSCFEDAVRIFSTDPHRWALLSDAATALLFKTDFEEVVAWATPRRWANWDARKRRGPQFSNCCKATPGS
ncbi:MAG: hypothetical protein KJN93_07990, partial [Alphaproteobacteria bacterium]|nr:hypothetical protein [Alphaproteobacteria bacterium]